MIRYILVVILIVAGIVGLGSKNTDGPIYKKAGFIICLIGALAAVLVISITDPGSTTDAPVGHTTTVEEDGDEEPSGQSPDVSEDSEEKEPSGDGPITEEPKYEIEYEGTVIDYDSFTDFFGHERNDVIYMEYDGTPSSIIIHTNGECSNISFDFYAVAEMDPEDMTQLTYIADEDSHSVHEYAAIPKYNSYGSFDEDITGRREIKITFHSAGIPSTEYPCAVLIDNLSIQ